MSPMSKMPGPDPLFEPPPAPSFRLDGNTALITGASRNIGRSIAWAFAQAGASLVLVARDSDRVDAVGAEIRERVGVEVTTIAADVSTPDGSDRILAATEHLPVDILINNAHTTGPTPGTSLLDSDDDVWEAVLSTNLLGPFRLCRGFGRRMRQLGHGSIVNVVSGSGLLPTPGLGPYGASKAALWMMTRFLAVEAAPTIRVNALCPGLVSEDGEPRNDAQRAIIDGVPMGRIASPDEIAGAALYLVSPAASYTTGELLVVNGGRAW